MSNAVITMLAAVPSTGSGHGGTKNPWILLFVGLVFLVVGGVQAVNPRLLWRMNRWRYRNPEANEPSDRGFLVQRLVGGVIAVVGAVVFVIALTKV